ncbi:hypothetical protein TPY_2165 [Sulfobacillus acidophilus TPY]|uniref:Uncharacterized protein n=1 Tax=Sulfobacillus acidophilus (strain ATCC 700253 / DSM 10332 / NAL) TaxID=679936 RepID=G8TZA4_SULAD|nr:hypothetical protein TPY_2165 [Sulfobacillus acidophilus TPY]AEW04073.1 hypothetical protein Sulac_0532 [Sulfobacillus acidophilus DSM 10332]
MSSVRVHDDLIAANLPELILHYNNWGHQLTHNPLADGLSAASYEQWLASINKRKLRLSYVELKEVLHRTHRPPQDRP